MSAARRRWKIRDVSDTYTNATVVEVGGGVVAQVWGGNRPTMERVRARAALIAVAPYLLELAELAENLQPWSNRDDFKKVQRMARRARRLVA